MLIPQSRKPIQIFIIRTIGMWAPSGVNDQTLSKNDLHIRLRSIEGHDSYLSSGDKPKFISFWATWCPPCIAELPAIQSLYNEFSEEMDFYLITTDEPEKVVAFLSQKKYQLPVYYQLQQLSPALDHNSIPYTVVVDTSGKVLFEASGARNWNSKKVKEAIRKSR